MASAGDFTMEQAKARSNNSAVKNLLYGGDAVSSEIGAQKGKKAMGYHASHPAPFATTNEGGCSGEVHKGKKTTGDHASYAAPYSTTEEGAHGGRVAEATKGKKTVGDHSSRTAPFATSEHVAAHPAYGQPSVSKNSKLKEQGAGKVGQAGFDPKAYSAALADNATTMEARRKHNQGGCGVFNNQAQAPPRVSRHATPQLGGNPARLATPALSEVLSQTQMISPSGEILSPNRPYDRYPGEELDIGAIGYD